MPCWEVRTMSVEFKTKHRRLLEDALKRLDYTWQETQNDVLVIPGLGRLDLIEGSAEIDRRDQKKLNQLKQQYSKECLRRAAKLQGWQLKTKGQTKGVLRR